MSSLNDYLKEWTKLVQKQKIIDSFDEYINSSDTNVISNSSNIFNNISLPIVKRVLGTTIAGGEWKKSEKQQLKEKRINKLRQLNGENPNVVLPDDIYVDGLVSVQPLSQPTGILFYMDYFYENPIKKTRKEKLKNINNIFRKEKLKYIHEVLSKNN